MLCQFVSQDADLCRPEKVPPGDGRIGNFNSYSMVRDKMQCRLDIFLTIGILSLAIGGVFSMLRIGRLEKRVAELEAKQPQVVEKNR